MIRIGALSGWARAAGSQSIAGSDRGVARRRPENPGRRAQPGSCAIPDRRPPRRSSQSCLSCLFGREVQVLYALADRGDAATREVVAGAVSAPEEDVRVAALFGLGKLGAASDVALLAERAAGAQGLEQATARESLYLLRGSGVDASIVARYIRQLRLSRRSN